MIAGIWEINAMKITYQRHRFFSRLTWGLLLVGPLFFTAPSYAEDPRVDSANPSSTVQGTYDLEVTVAGDNFGPDSTVDFFITDTSDPGGIRVKKVKRRGPKTLKVTIDVAPDAQTELDFDICVRSRGRTGKRTELFRVMRKTNWVWGVELPEDGDFNMLRGQPIYKDTGSGDGVWVDVTKEGGGRDGPVTHFEFAIYKCDSNDAVCYGLSPEPVTLQNITWDPAGIFVDPTEGPPCIFPGNCGELTNESECLMCFVNRQHPYWGAGQDENQDDYRYFQFSVRVRGDFTNLEAGSDPVQSWGELRMTSWNTSLTLIDPYEDDHGIYSYVELPGDERGYVEVARLPDGSWRVVVQVNNVYPRMFFIETYIGCFKPVNKKGNCPGEQKQTIWAYTSGQPGGLTFEATWLQISQ